MAGLYSSSSSSSSSSFQTFASRLLLLLTILPLTLAVFAFVLQWRGGLNDPVTRWSPDHHEFPGMGSALGGPLVQASSHSDCVDLLGRTHSPSFPYFRDWKFDYASDLRPKVSCPLLLRSIWLRCWDWFLMKFDLISIRLSGGLCLDFGIWHLGLLLSLS